VAAGQAKQPQNCYVHHGRHPSPPGVHSAAICGAFKSHGRHDRWPYGIGDQRRSKRRLSYSLIAFRNGQVLSPMTTDRGTLRTSLSRKMRRRRRPQPAVPCSRPWRWHPPGLPAAWRVRDPARDKRPGPGKTAVHQARQPTTGRPLRHPRGRPRLAPSAGSMTTRSPQRHIRCSHAIRWSSRAGGCCLYPVNTLRAIPRRAEVN
jgi:hypothetical protein